MVQNLIILWKRAANCSLDYHTQWTARKGPGSIQQLQML